MKYKQIWKTAASCLVAALMFPSCSDDEGGGGDVQDDRYRTLVVTINSRSNAEPVGTRADLEGPAENEITTEADKEYERTIMSWWLIILKKSTTGTDEYTVERVLSSEGGTTTDPEEYFSTTNDTNDRFDTSIDVELEVDQTYRFYALANLEGLKNAETVIENINSLKKDKTFDLTSLNAQLKDMPAYHDGEGGTYIPMSSYGYEQYVDENTSKLKEDIELIRLIGKVTLEVRNKTGKDLTLKKLQMGQFRSAGDIYLFPWDVNGKSYLLLRETGKLNNIEGNIPKFPTSSTEEDFTSTTFYSDETGMSIPQYDDSKEETGAKYFMYYVNETYNTKASDPELQIMVETNPKRNENEKPSGFSFVRRNDWLQIPVQITNVTTRIEFDQKHMPIGGLPESLEFGKISVPIAYCRTTHGGDITVNFALTEVSGMGSNPQLSFYSGSYEGGTEHYTSAILRDNQNDILIHTPEDNDAAPWLDETENAIPVTAGQPAHGIIGQGSFTVTAQELAATTNGQAEIELRMVITDGTQYMTIPYTIYITNQSN